MEEVGSRLSFRMEVVQVSSLQPVVVFEAGHHQIGGHEYLGHLLH